MNIPFSRRFVIANDVFKFKEFNLDSKQCRRTSLAPRFGNPVTTLLPIPPDPSTASIVSSSQPAESPAVDNGFDPAVPIDDEDQQPKQDVPIPSVPHVQPAVPEYFAFATDTRVIGLSSFPLTGDPSQVRL